jgi:phosphomannomutase
MQDIKFGTDGWRAIIAEDFTVENVVRVTEAVGKWLLAGKKQPSVTVGHDCRFGGALFAGTVARVLAGQGIRVYLAEGFVSTPMVSLGTVRTQSDLGIIITASHNPPSYNGYKLKGSYGGPLSPGEVSVIESGIAGRPSEGALRLTLAAARQRGMVEQIDLEGMYIRHLQEHFDLDAIRNSGMKLAYDAMYGAGQQVIRKLFPGITLLHCDDNPGFHGQAPEPILKNLGEFSALIRDDGAIRCGLVTDGDADRIGMFDSKGNFVDSHHIILLLIHYLCKYKGLSGKVCVAFSTTPRVENMCRHYGLPLEIVKIGFKYICEIMQKEDVLLGGEESGGIALKGHLPERDGIWVGLVIWEFMAKSGKTLEELIGEVYAIVGEFAFERSDLHLDEDLKSRIVEKCRNGEFSSFGTYTVRHTEDLDGFKYFFDDDRRQWLLIRPSGTEPVLRTYAEAATAAGARSMLAEVEAALLKS